MNLLLTLPFMANNTVPYNSDIYWIRFFVVLWFLIFPCLFTCIFIFLRDSFKERAVIITYRFLKDFREYSYFFHNCLFIFFMGAMFFNTCFFIYSIFDTFILKLEHFYSWLWRIPATTDEEQKMNFFKAITLPSYIFHSIAFFVYIYHNLYRTDSYFGEKWRANIPRLSRKKLFTKLESKRPKLYSFIHKWFFDLSQISQTAKLVAIT